MAVTLVKAVMPSTCFDCELERGTFAMLVLLYATAADLLSTNTAGLI